MASRLFAMCGFWDSGPLGDRTLPGSNARANRERRFLESKRRGIQFARTETTSRLASILRHDRTIIRIIPPMMVATLKSINRTLHEKPALIPLTPDAPATFEGSLHPGHAIREGTKFIKKRLSHTNERSMMRISIISRSRARGFRGQSAVFGPPPQMSHRSTLESCHLHQREQKLSFQNERARYRTLSPPREIQFF
jgi:hypothetical protein